MLLLLDVSFEGVVAVAALASKGLADSMIVILMGMDLHLEDRAASVVLQEEISVVRAEASVRQEDMEEVGVGIAETSNVKVLVGTKTGIRNGLDISWQLVAGDVANAPEVTVYVAPYFGERCVSFEVGLFIAFYCIVLVA